MPKKYTKLRSKLKKLIHKRGRPRMKSRVTTFSRVVGFPEAMTTKLVYNQSFSLTSISGSQIMRGNAPFDPDFTGGGNQPNYFDNYTAIYTKYRCFGSKIEIKLINASATIAARFCLLPSDLSATLTNVINAGGNPMAKMLMLGVASSSRSLATMRGYCTTARINGKTKQEIRSGDQYEAVTTGNPADPWFWILQYEDVGLASACNIVIDIKQTFYVKFSDKGNANLS